MTPAKPRCAAGVCADVNTDSVFDPPAFTISSTASTRNTRISNAPRIVPIVADTRAPQNPATPTITAPSSAHGHHRPCG